MSTNNDEMKSIDSEIKRLARRTGAPSAFVDLVRRFFEEKLIALSVDVEPYRVALEESFLLEETVRRNTVRARENLVRLQDCLRLVGATYQQQVGQLRRVRDSLEQQSRVVQEGTLRLRDGGRSPARTRTLLGGPKGAFLVPGPRDIQ